MEAFDINADIPVEEQIPDEGPKLTVSRQEPSGFDWASLLKAKTGSGPVEDYLEHPLNFGRSTWLARVIRGLTGLIGELDLAIVDVIIGLAQGFTGGRASG